jgi:hypothetical protein
MAKWQLRRKRRLAENPQWKVILTADTEGECFNRFLRVCPFSWNAHRKYSHTIYDIVQVKEEDIDE